MAADASVTLLAVVSNALSRLAEKLPPSLAERATALAADGATLGTRLARIRQSPTDGEALERQFYRTWIATQWILFDDLSHMPSRRLTPDEEAEWRRAWQFSILANPQRQAVIRAKAMENIDSEISWSGPDSAITAGTGTPSAHADLGDALIRAGAVYDAPEVTSAITAAVKTGWRNIYGDQVSLLQLATDAFICGPRDIGALAAFWPLLLDDTKTEDPMDRIWIARAGMALLNETRLPRRVVEFSWFVSGWRESGERWQLFDRPLSMDDLDPLIVDLAQEFDVSIPAVEQVLLAGIDTPDFTTDSGARRSLYEAVKALHGLLAELRTLSQAELSFAIVFKKIVEAIDEGDLTLADQILAAFIEEAEENRVAADKAGGAIYVASMYRLRANLSAIRFDCREAARCYDRSAAVIVDQNPESAMYARGSQAAMLNLLAERAQEPEHLRTALALWREEVAPLARTVGTRETLVDANVGLGHALRALANQTGDLAFIAEAVTAFRAGLHADRLVALDGPGSASAENPSSTGSPTVDEVRAGFLMVENLLRIAFENPLEFLAEAEAVLNQLRPWISREEHQAHWGWMRMLEAWLAIERIHANATRGNLDDLAARLTEAAEALTPISRLQWARCWLLLGQEYEVAASCGDATRLPPCIDCLQKAKDALSPAEHDLWLQAVFGLANAYHMMFEGTRYLPYAIAWLGHLRSSLAATTRQRSPSRWIIAQHHLGDALSVHFERGGHPDTLDAALDCYREALSGRTQVEDPEKWLSTTFRIGQVLAERGSWNRNRAEIAEATQLLHEARAFAERREDRDSVEAIDRRLARAAMLAEALDAPQAPPKRGIGAWLRQKIGGRQ